MQEVSSDVLSCKSCDPRTDGSLFGTDVRILDCGYFLYEAGSANDSAFNNIEGDAICYVSETKGSLILL